MNFRPDERKGFQWWTVGWGADWFKLGPVSFKTWTLPSALGFGEFRVLELHVLNRLRLLL